MCLGIPGQVVEISDAEKKLGIVDVSGVRREVNLACIANDEPLNDLIGVWTLVRDRPPGPGSQTTSRGALRDCRIHCPDAARPQ